MKNGRESEVQGDSVVWILRLEEHSYKQTERGKWAEKVFRERKGQSERVEFVEPEEGGDISVELDRGCGEMERIQQRVTNEWIRESFSKRWKL